jgi:NAD(P)-dependent dehydrogenase (short-subunit alcohol dehydrogenase family)
MTPSFSGQHVVVTGGDGVLGTAVVDALVAAGAECYLPVLGAAEANGRTGVHAIGRVDLSDEPAVERYFAGLPPIAASIHLAGGFAAKPIAETSRVDLDKQLSINFFTTFFCCREAIKAMRKTGGGRIVNVAARVVEKPAGGMSAYVVAKSAVAALTRALAEEVHDDGILINAIMPSIIDTPSNRKSMPKSDFDDWPKPTELARSILWLASTENALTSGALVPVYGRS